MNLDHANKLLSFVETFDRLFNEATSVTLELDTREAQALRAPLSKIWVLVHSEMEDYVRSKMNERNG